MFNETNLLDEIFLLKWKILPVWCDALAGTGVVARAVTEPVEVSRVCGADG